jgi:fused signal recognition particle receptor
MIFKNIFKGSIKTKLNTIFSAKKTKEEVLEELEETLILADISMDVTSKILSNLKKNSKLTFSKEDFYQLLKAEMLSVFTEVSAHQSYQYHSFPLIVMLVGVNGSGKTTSAAKIAHYFVRQGKSVLLSAADTFRAAGSTQLALWGDRLNIPVIGGDQGADTGSVVYNSLSSFKAKNYQVLVIDTAGRVQTKDNLMKELNKVTKIISTNCPQIPVEVLLVIDATMGQNTLDQAKKFKEFSGISGILLTKFDGTAKGGTIINILHEMQIPVKFIGIGEKAADLELFSPQEFIDSLLES